MENTTSSQLQSLKNNTKNHCDLARLLDEIEVALKAIMASQRRIEASIQLMADEQTCDAFSRKKTCQKIGISDPTLTAWQCTGRIHGTRTDDGGDWLFTRVEIQRALKKRFPPPGMSYIPDFEPGSWSDSFEKNASQFPTKRNATISQKGKRTLSHYKLLRRTTVQ